MAGRSLASGDLRHAQALCLEVLAAAPGIAEAHFILGAIAASRGARAEALVAFDRALEARPGFVQALAQKARVLDALGRREEAVEVAQIAAGAQDAYTLDTIGVVMTRAGLHERSIEFYGRAAAIANAPGYWYNYASALQFVGRFDEARAAFRACLNGDPRHGPAWASLVQITRQTREANEIAPLTRIAERSGADPQAMLALGHALAKAHEDLGQETEAMDWLMRAKAAMRHRHDPRADSALFAAAEQSASLTPVQGYAGAAPIFVVGMPRTGTTLVDRILTSHSLVDSAGELSTFSEALQRATGVLPEGLISHELIVRAAAVEADVVGRDYMAAVKGALGFEGRFVDKLPLNVFLAPLILRALPDARVICLRRHPADAVLSNYRQNFARGAVLLDYVFDLEATATYYVFWDRMVKRFAATLPSHRFCEVAYEDIVANLDGEVRRLLEFSGLEFEAACVNFQDNAAPVATASAAQVRQPIYASSVGRWRKYRPAMDSALRILVEAGVMDRAELA